MEDKEKMRKFILRSIMKAKVLDAKNVIKVEDFKYHQSKKVLDKDIENYEIKIEFQKFKNIEAKIEWNALTPIALSF